MQTTQTVSFNALRASVFRTIAGQDYQNGFVLDLSPLPTRKLIISPRVVSAMDEFGSASPSLAQINALITGIIGIPPRGAVLCAMWYIVNDMFDLMSVTGGQPLEYTYNVGSGMGLHAALLNSKHVSLHEINETLTEIARTVFKDNGIESFSINAAPEAQADLLFSFLGCGYSFPLNRYIPHINLSKRVVLDLNDRFMTAEGNAVIRSFPAKTPIRTDGVGADAFTRTLLSR